MAGETGPGHSGADSGTGFTCLLIPCASSSQDPSSEERFHVELHFSPGVKGCEEDRNVPTGFGFRPASAEVSLLPGHGSSSTSFSGLFRGCFPCPASRVSHGSV